MMMMMMASMKCRVCVQQEIHSIVNETGEGEKEEEEEEKDLNRLI